MQTFFYNPSNIFRLVTGDRERFSQHKKWFKRFIVNSPRFMDLLPLILYEVCPSIFFSIFLL